jgi:plastocyanin
VLNHRVTSRRLLAATAVATVAALLLTSCTNTKAPLAKTPQSGSGTASSVAGVQQITVLTGPDLRFHPSVITVHTGKVEVILKNQEKGGSSGPPHNFEVTGLPGAFVPLTTSGQVGMVTFTAGSPGRYPFVCTIHEQEGQTGTLIVKSGSAG